MSRKKRDARKRQAKQREQKQRKQQHVYHYRNTDTGDESWSVKDDNGEILAKGWKFGGRQPFDFLMAEYERKFGGAPPEDMTLAEIGEKVGMPFPTNEEYIRQASEAMEKAGMAPEFVYAFRKTNLLITSDNQHMASDRDLAEWQEAIEEYRRTHS